MGDCKMCKNTVLFGTGIDITIVHIRLTHLQYMSSTNGPRVGIRSLT